MMRSGVRATGLGSLYELVPVLLQELSGSEQRQGWTTVDGHTQEFSAEQRESGGEWHGCGCCYPLVRYAMVPSQSSSQPGAMRCCSGSELAAAASSAAAAAARLLLAAGGGGGGGGRDG